MHKHNNKLVHETSPYLLQHAHNPVDWYPWGDEALKRAREENKPVLVSIGYSACHWCHVMEKESFEDEATAGIMNDHFINIKIDREERPDLDHIYMDAVQAMTGSGGWPLNVFLTPEGKPFYGGTYFPPRQAFNRPSWQDVLRNISQAFREKRHEIDAQAENLTNHLLQSNSFGLQRTPADEVFTRQRLHEAADNIMKAADTEWGGFGRAPKFPQTFTIQFLLRYCHSKKDHAIKDTEVSPPAGGGDIEAVLRQALLSLDKMIEGGIYDQAGGGFARYATDTEWLVPHFEKMLYDNALLVSVLSEAYQLTRKPRYREVINETIQFIQRELLHGQGGFYSALDADSEGVEGKFYVWEYEEANKLLGEDAGMFCAYYDITPKGNWEGVNILRVPEPAEAFARRVNIGEADLKALLERGKKKIMEVRAGRVRPGLDDKILLGWNALMNTAASKAYAATGEESYRQLAITNMNFLFDKFSAGDKGFYHTWKNDQARYPAFLDDYAFLVQALLQLQEVTGDQSWLDKAAEITTRVIDRFSETDTGFFFYTGHDQDDVIVRKKEVYDGAVPSGNAVMAQNLHQLGLLLDNREWRQRSMDMVTALGKAVIKYPTSFGVWAMLLQEMTVGTNEIAIVGPGHGGVLKEVLAEYIPHRVLMASERPLDLPLLAGKTADSKTNIWLCRDYSCKHPVGLVKDLIALIDSDQAGN
jgi:uncharacterized protein